jgi:hypothetical protein
MPSWRKGNCGSHADEGRGGKYISRRGMSGMPGVEEGAPPAGHPASGCRTRALLPMRSSTTRKQPCRCPFKHALTNAMTSTQQEPMHIRHASCYVSRISYIHIGGHVCARPPSHTNTPSGRSPQTQTLTPPCREACRRRTTGCGRKGSRGWCRCAWRGPAPCT